MAVNSGLLAISDALTLVITAIEAVELALNRSPAPDDRLTLMARLSDLTTLRNRLQARQTQIVNSRRVIPAPDSTLMAEIESLLRNVESARIAGTAANAVVGVARQAFDVAGRVLQGVGPG